MCSFVSRQSSQSALLQLRPTTCLTAQEITESEALHIPETSRLRRRLTYALISWQYLNPAFHSAEVKVKAQYIRLLFRSG
ncbi:hypothetical protein Mycsm_03996 [Mycobacterium sp. JS623]|nr:hypothetical protein Mycsm_03996 [Mycobacterium sp. JS623]